eukprot:TRINITY_DN3571_c0_g1_i1.p1 TRINITY_DN3571_c0_g1~~TRINITY_DN3571_c0_g1_i1.p1  ORF type:complete len:204 (+),score=33.96 TRINITY_DN3571_c0_g1_i1:109-720(+)
MGFEKRIVVDAKGHLLGRLASIVAKQLLEGQQIVVVRCEEINISGKFIRNKIIFLQYLRKRTAFNTKRGHHHFRSPAKIFWRTVRGMLPHKTDRGERALARLKVFEGIPPPFNKMKRVVVPDALRVLKLKPMRKYTLLGRLSSEVGWKHGEVVKRLEERRKLKGKAWYDRKKTLEKFKKQALKENEERLQPQLKVLESYGLVQ